MTNITRPNDLAWMHGPPSANCTIRSEPEDFRVRELLGYEPIGQGEHLYVLIRKIGENTDWVAGLLAKFFAVSSRQVTYAGKKDRHAITEQWFSVHLPGKPFDIDWSLFESETVKVLRSARHGRKIKLGNLYGNEFQIRLREIDDLDSVIARIPLLERGVPNYFGEQRFGLEGGNLAKGLALLEGRLEEKQRHKRGLYISAVRSQIFNQILNERVLLDFMPDPISGDTLIEPYSQRCEPWNPENLDQQERILLKKLVPSAPMWGEGDLYSFDKAKALEERIGEGLKDACDGLARLGLRQERRAALLVPENLAYEDEANRQLLLKFSLPSGCFATSVIRELCFWK